MHRFLIVALALVTVIVLAAAPLRGQVSSVLIGFELDQYFEALRQQAGIPGLSAAILQDRQIVWERGFGKQDIEASVSATPDTPYQIAGLTQTLAATLLLKCMEYGQLDLNAPIGDYQSAISEPSTTVRHVLMHLSEGVPPSKFKLDTRRYAALTPVIEACAEQPFQQALANDILDRLAMVDSVPGQEVLTRTEEESGFDAETLDRYARVVRRLAKPYRVDRNGKASLSEYPRRTLDAAGGVIASVRDLARFDSALDEGILLEANTLALAWSRSVGANGIPNPHGLGWFVQTHNNNLVVWQFGEWPNSTSSLIVKLPRNRATMILLANSDGLATLFQLAAGDVTTSPFARLFLRLFG